MVHFAYSDYIWLSKISATGSRTGVQETIKVNQVKGMYIEDSNITGANDNAIDFVAVQYGHICRNKIWNADWCVYAKGGEGGRGEGRPGGRSNGNLGTRWSIGKQGETKRERVLVGMGRQSKCDDRGRG